MFSGRLLEIQAELDRHHNKQSRLEMTADNAQLVSIELVRSLIQQFDQLMESSTFKQRKTLMHLVISKIIVSKDKNRSRGAQLRR